MALCIKANAKNVKNCVNPPIFVTEKEDRPFPEIITLPQLPFMLRVVNTLYKHLLEKYKQDALA